MAVAEQKKYFLKINPLPIN